MSLAVTKPVARVSGTPNNNVDITSASFTPAANSLLVACVNRDSNTGAGVAISVSGGSLTWTERKHQDGGNTTGGVASIWTAPVGASPAAMTVSARATNGISGDTISLTVYYLTGESASPIGASGQGNNSGTPPVTLTAFTSTAANSEMLVVATDWAAKGAPTSADLTVDSAHFAGLISATSGYKALGAIASQTFQMTHPAPSGAWNSNWVALEILPAVTVASLPVFQRPARYFSVVRYKYDRSRRNNVPSEEQENSSSRVYSLSSMYSRRENGWIRRGRVICPR